MLDSVCAAYIHIPFCKKICSYCDFCKVLYDKKIVQTYLQMLSLEIEERYKGEILSSIYIGGGTPSCLDTEDLNTLFSIVNKLKKDASVEYTIECNIENICAEKLSLFLENGVNRLSIGVQTFHLFHLQTLHRSHTKEEIYEKISLAKEMGFTNINIDLMYGFASETLLELREDLDAFFTLDIPHLSIYSLILEPHTLLFVQKVKPLEEQLESDMYLLIQKMLSEKGYIQYEVSNFAKEGYFSKHNLTYWNNEHYYGFGVGSSGYIGNIRYDHTRSVTQYNQKHFALTKDILDTKRTMENEWMLGFRKTKGISKKEFFTKYHVQLNTIPVIASLLQEGLLAQNESFVYIPKDHIYVMNEILVKLINSKENEDG